MPLHSLASLRGWYRSFVLMKIFISAPSEHYAVAEDLSVALRSAGYGVFFARHDLLPGESFHDRIAARIAKSDLFLFLVCPESLDRGAYTLTELQLAEARWPNAAGNVVPLLIAPVPVPTIPSYLKSVTILEPYGDTVAETLVAIDKLRTSRRTSTIRRYSRLGTRVVLAVALVAAVTLLVDRMFLRPRVPKPTILVDIPAGKFQMGCLEGRDDLCVDRQPGFEDHGMGPSPEPIVTLDLAAFRLEKTEVTVEQFRRCVRAGVCSDERLRRPFWDVQLPSKYSTACNYNYTDRDDHPINCVNFDDALTYCTWIGRRLPTEQEWEKAASWEAEKTIKYIYPWGDDWDSARLNADSVGTVPVGSYPHGASPYGLLDMAGNVMEWTATWYDAARVILRGGAWRLPLEGRIVARTSYRDKNYPRMNYETAGFRCAADK